MKRQELTDEQWDLIEPLVFASHAKTGRPPRRRPQRLTGDKAYSVRSVRDWLQARGIRPVVPHKINERTYHDRRTRSVKRRSRAAPWSSSSWVG